MDGGSTTLTGTNGASASSVDGGSNDTLAQKKAKVMEIFILLALAQFALALTNTVEQPFARSLVSCATPVGNFTGSANCGDRLHVIGEGARTSAVGQSYEFMSRVVMTLLIGTIADIYGRKFGLLLGLSGLTLSLLLFFVAGYTEWGTTLFAIAQGLQGVHGMDILGNCIISDISKSLHEEDSLSLFTRKGVLDTGFGFVAFNAGLVVTLRDFTDFTYIWFVLLTSMIGLTAWIVFRFEEPRVEVPAALRRKPLSGIVSAEVQSFYDLVVHLPCTRIILVNAMCEASMSCSFTMWGPFLMAFFGYSQGNVMVSLYFFLLLCPVVVSKTPDLIRIVGLVNFFKVAYAWRNLWVLLFCFINGFWIWKLPALIVWMYLAQMPVTGLGPMYVAVYVKMVGEENTTKFHAVNSIVSQLTASVSYRAYAYLFDATATDYIGIHKMWFLCGAFQLLNLFVYYNYGAKLIMPIVEEMERESIAADKAKAESDKAKTD